MTGARPGRIEVVGHGGAGAFFPGNSREAIEQALRIGVDRIEVDVQRSFDGDLVLVHDEEIRIRGRKRPVEEIRTVDLRSLYPGFLTFDELMELNRDRLPLLLDVKLPGYEREVIAAIHHYDLAECSAVSSTHALVLGRLRRAFPTMRLGLSTGHLATGIPYRAMRAAAAKVLQVTTPIPIVQVAQLCGATDVMIQHRVCSDWLVRSAHRSGRRVYVWTVDRPDQIHRVVAMGVDGVISNRPDLVREVIAASERDKAARESPRRAHVD
jgi:glycerophosphoryl diester phosphodiesterase